MAPETSDQIAELQRLIDEGFASGISSRSKDDIRALGLKKLAEANKKQHQNDPISEYKSEYPARFDFDDFI